MISAHCLRFVVVAMLFVCSCSLIREGITYYDPTTYKNLTDLKPEVIMLYESFVGELIDTVWIHSIKLKLAQMYEYERGKGPKNKETMEQIDIIRKMFERHFQQRMKEGKWNEEHLFNNQENISDAFDIAIQTERLKNRNE
ncbi:MAG: hypothetical protein QME52_06905 [Bacteroidota bacterium]|nr:hypothetical protein [Bacteroidota bacterium]